MFTREAFAPFVLTVALVSLFPFAVRAMSDQADQMCNPVIMLCPTCGMVPDANGNCIQKGPQANKYMCPPGICKDTTSGFTTLGTCVAPNKCEGKVTAEGKSPGLGQVGDILKGIMDALKGMKGGGGGGSPPPSPSGTGATPNGVTCSTYYQVSTPSSDPCAYYVPPPIQTPTSTIDLSNLGGCDALSAALGNCNNGSNSGSTGGSGLINLTNTNATSVNPFTDTSTNTSSNTTSVNPFTDILTNTNTNTNTNPNTNAEQRTPAVTSVGGTIVVTQLGGNQQNLSPSAVASQIVSLQPGVRGDISVFNSGATIFVANQDTQSNTVTAGFYGSNTAGSQQPQGLVAQLCVDRPWATNFLSYIVPPSFFDSLCTWRGYQVGSPPAAVPQVILTQQTVKNQTATTSKSTATSTPLIPPKVQIWATPARVALGARTSVFWSTQGVTNCTETSPDGSFHQNSLSGGASTVPITGPTTFAISCQAPDGTPITSYVMVNISI